MELCTDLCVQLTATWKLLLAGHWVQPGAHVLTVHVLLLPAPALPHLFLQSQPLTRGEGHVFSMLLPHVHGLQTEKKTK